jgi:hypothetical protein
MRRKGMIVSRREFVRLAGIAVAGSMVGARMSAEAIGGAVALFDGRTLDGWIQSENNATSLSSGEIADPAAFARKLANGTDAVSIFLRGHLDDPAKAAIDTYSSSGESAKAVISALLKDLNQVIAGPSIYDDARFRGVALRPQTNELLMRNPAGLQLARLNMLLLEDAYPAELTKSVTTGWIVKDGAMAIHWKRSRSHLYGERL